jgi:6-phosphogluconolactonase
LAEAAAFIAERVRGAVRERGACDLVLAGGRTPRGVYRQLARPEEADLVPWQKVRWFWGDERFVPPEHEDSNYRMAREQLLEHVRPPARNVFPIPTDAADASQAAERYERRLRLQFPGASFPVFDLVLLGLGADGHTASLFPGGPECDEAERWCVASRAPEGSPAPDRVTLTLPALSAARCAAFLVAGGDKRGALAALLGAGSADPREDRPPAGRIRARELYCFTDLQ